MLTEREGPLEAKRGALLSVSALKFKDRSSPVPINKGENASNNDGLRLDLITGYPNTIFVLKRIYGEILNSAHNIANIKMEIKKLNLLHRFRPKTGCFLTFRARVHVFLGK